jgi:hypothetical protein
MERMKKGCRAVIGALSKGGWWQVTDNRRCPVDEPQGEVGHRCKSRFRPVRRSVWLIGWRRTGLFEKSEVGRILPEESLDPAARRAAAPKRIRKPKAT